MGRIISITNQKGGVGKTTTAINLSAALAEKRKHVLLIDLDSQGNATSGLGIDKNSVDNSIYELLINECQVEECICKTNIKRLDIIPSNINLSGAEIELVDMDDKEYLLKKQTEKIRNDYDYIIIDCPPSLSMLTINALTASDSIIVPIQCEYYALEGLTQLIKTEELIKERLNPELTIEGIVFTMFDARTNLSSQVVETVKNNLNQHIYKTTIPRNVRLAESPSYGMPVTEYDSKSSGAKAYRSLAKEVIKNRR